LGAVVVLGVLGDAASVATLPAGNINVVANASVTADALSLSTLRAVFLMRATQWPDGTPITVFVLPDRDDRHVAFCTMLLKTFPYVLRDTWDRAVFTGTGQAPIQVANEEELQRRLAATRGAIGYLQAEKAPDDKIKLLKIR
jgi:ABC-type phosphate transport system substrate-binding protein